MLGLFSTCVKKQYFQNFINFNLSTDCVNGRKIINDFSYNIGDKIGKGFSSIVYKGVNIRTSNHILLHDLLSYDIVAIKVIDMNGFDNAISKEMLECQIDALKTIKHENVLKCYNIFKQQNLCFIVTEFCDGGDLSKYLKKKKRLSEEQTLILLRDIVLGFIEIVQSGFLHRDLKLANIFLSDNRAKIADFGFSKKVKSSIQKYNIGSPMYMSPQSLKKNMYSIKSDIWSIGIMVYEMIYGQIPWQCRTHKQLIFKITKMPVQFKNQIIVSDNIKNFIKKCLQVQEKNRMSLDNLKEWVNLQLNKDIELENASVFGFTLQNVPSMITLPKNTDIKRMSFQHETQFTQMELTQKFSTLSHKQLRSQQNKQNIIYQIQDNETIPKSLILGNNAILANQINTFRLMYKLMKKLKKQLPEQLKLIAILGNEVIKKVTILKNCFENHTNQLGLLMIDNYMNEQTNRGIKKYKSVVLQYYRKYTSQIKFKNIDNMNSSQINNQILKFLSRKQNQFKQQQELLIAYWMIEYLKITKETSKQKLDEIINPKIKFSQNYIKRRIKELI